jgi:hypothetical protein
MDESSNDMPRSHQYFDYDGIRATDVVLNADELTRHLISVRPAEITAYGYWGAPSVTAVTPYGWLCFAEFSNRKRSDGREQPRFHLTAPLQIRNAVELVRR